MIVHTNGCSSMLQQLSTMGAPEPLRAVSETASPLLSCLSLASECPVIKEAGDSVHANLVCCFSQPFWGNMIFRAGAGPSPIPYASLNFQRLTAAIQFCLTPEAREAAHRISLKMKNEAGVDAAVESFHRNLPIDRMRCDLIPNQVASWKYKKSAFSLSLSKKAAQILIENHKITKGHLEL